MQNTINKKHAISLTPNFVFWQYVLHLLRIVEPIIFYALTIFFCIFCRSLPPHISLKPLSPLNLLTLPQPLGAAHLTSPLSGRPPYHTHPTPSPSDTPTDPIPSTRHAQDVGVKNVCLVLVLAIRSTWSWALPSRPPWCLLLTWAADAPLRPSMPRHTSPGQRHKRQLRPEVEVEDLPSMSCLCGARCRYATGWRGRCSLPSWSCSRHRQRSGKPPWAAVASDVPDLLLPETTLSRCRRPHPKLASSRWSPSPPHPPCIHCNFLFYLFITLMQGILVRRSTRYNGCAGHFFSVGQWMCPTISGFMIHACLLLYYCIENGNRLPVNVSNCQLIYDMCLLFVV
jgi:hypothetical protein